MAKKLVLLTYTPRELDEDEYAKFIREIDYPAFRQNPDILDYSCWRASRASRARSDSRTSTSWRSPTSRSWQAIVADPVVRGNVERWTREWSRHGPEHPDQAENLGHLLRALLGIASSLKGCAQRTRAEGPPGREAFPSPKGSVRASRRQGDAGGREHQGHVLRALLGLSFVLMLRATCDCRPPSDGR